MQKYYKNIEIANLDVEQAILRNKLCLHCFSF